MSREKAIEQAKRALASSPDSMEIQSLLTRMYLAEEQWQNALDVVNGMAITQDSLPAYWVLKGQTLLRNNRLREAADHYNQWIAFSPNNKQAVMGKLLLLDNDREFIEAQQITEAFLAIRDDAQINVLYTHLPDHESGL